MGSLRRLLLLKAFQSFDLLALCAACVAAAWLVRGGRPVPFGPAVLAYEVRVGTALVAAVAGVLLLIVWHALFAAVGLYRSKRLTRRWRELREVALATTLATLALGLWLAVFPVPGRSLAFILAFWASATLLLIASRLLLRRVLAIVRRRGRNERHVLVVGTGALALRFVRRLDEEPALGLRLLGFVDDEWPRLAAFRETGRALLGRIDDIPRLLRDLVIDEVAICLPLNSRYAEAERTAHWCVEQGILVRVPTGLFDTDFPRPLDPWEVMTLNPSPLYGASAVIKRLLDVVVSAALLVLLLPLFAVVAVLIRLDSPGPVLFRQQRRGLQKRPFTMLKFRTMTADAEQRLVAVQAMNEETGPAFKIRNDPRITRVGRLLRKLSIDEMPQLVNVLRGEMSLVGPRPLFAWEFERIEEPWVKRRCSVRPGLTGLWQVSGRSDLPFDRRVQLDLEYIDNWSLDLDLRILARTIPVVVTGRGAA